MISTKSLILLASAYFVSAAVFDVQVGNANGTLAYSPEAIVSCLFSSVFANVRILSLYFSLLNRETKLFSILTPKITL